MALSAYELEALSLKVQILGGETPLGLAAARF